ncbi:hypothetical protein [Algisphaera agarilytica]|uniref:Uncharacterized protein n=1 Tax=Algisphaera agarilytica TaxID=1385975 RepID=A0A7X0LJV9_9BACT|nr:hypothetical protein [Algisphaera agarilytica]MBB6429795.1 hypothetical protein [Algisphaera agarilytica]
MSLTLGLAVGCATSNDPAVQGNPAAITIADYPEAFQISAEVLRDAGFQVDRRDFRFGKVSTKPKGSPTLIEAWKPDNTYPDQSVRSTLGDLRRTVTVNFLPQNDAPHADAESAKRLVSTYDLRVEVLVERLQIPQRRMNGSTNGVVFADLAEVPEELQARGITQSYWEPIGRDVHLEQRLLQQILDRVEEG